MQRNTAGEALTKAEWRVVQGESLAILQALPDGSVDAVITDPPYSSGGFGREDKAKPPEEKYISGGTKRQYPTFGGDNRDQRSYLAWSALWISECVRALKPGGYFLTFTDWRQLPVMTDAIQAGGVVWRGLIAWDKGRGARAPHKGYFRHQCEYVVWGTKGSIERLTHAGPFDGCLRETVRQADKFHMTGKPTALMRELVKPVVEGGLILDPFAGSGTTGVAAVMEGRRFLGIEKERVYAELAECRIAEAVASRGAHLRTNSASPDD